MPVEQATRPVLRIFISSTAVDLLTYREKVRDAVLRLESMPIAMETFSAQSGQPAGECMKMAAEADAVICIVAHRYGYVPPRELGGDGERSITWLEVDAAKEARKPVFAFLVDPKVEWTSVKEQDRLVTEPDKAPEIVKAVQKLQDFKACLEREHTRKTFKNPDELATVVTAALANFARQASHFAAFTTRIWTPLFCHALQPAQHFRGRQTKLKELRDWLKTPVTPDRVISVVAPGGTGKTALVYQALKESTLTDRAGIFVWSFYEDPHTDAFLRAAYLYFTGEKDTPTGGMLERLQIALSGDVPHALVIDGLERVQSGGDHSRRGELEDLQLKRLVRALAGGIGAARALVTSRFPLVDLDEFTGTGHRAIMLDDLELPVALDVLRAWKVKGDANALRRLLNPLNIGGYYHALSVAALGSYIGNFAGGDPTRAPAFSLEDAKESDPKARRLSRILEQHYRALPRIERDLLARLALFPRGVEVEVLSWIIEAGGEVAGTLVGLTTRQLVQKLERLKDLGLVFRYESYQQMVFSAHPFMREFFGVFLRINPQSIHESVRSKLAPSLEAQPEAPRDFKVLDQYELLIEETLLAGRFEEAFDLYRTLGGYRNLGATLGENGRGLRILEWFFPKDDFSKKTSDLLSFPQIWLVNDLGLFALSLGDLNRARNAFAHSCQLYTAVSDQKSASISAHSLGVVELHAGRFPKAREHSDTAFFLATQAKDKIGTKGSLAVRAAAKLLIGDIAAAEVDFQHANDLEGKRLFSFRGIIEAECKLLRGNLAGALSQTQDNREIALRNEWNVTLCRCNALLARLLFCADLAQAERHLHNARDFATRSGDVDLQLRCFQAACELHLQLGDHPQAINEAKEGILLADTCGFGRFSIDLRLAIAETLLATGEASKALQNARSALDRSEHENCQYAWGKADGLHFCGLAHLRLGEIVLARQRLAAAFELRERLGHGRIEETRRALASLPPLAASDN